MYIDIPLYNKQWCGSVSYLQDPSTKKVLDPTVNALVGTQVAKNTFCQIKSMDIFSVQATFLIWILAF